VKRLAAILILAAALAGCGAKCTVTREADGTVSVSCELPHKHDDQGNLVK